MISMNEHRVNRLLQCDTVPPIFFSFHQSRERFSVRVNNGNNFHRVDVEEEKMEDVARPAFERRERDKAVKWTPLAHRREQVKVSPFPFHPYYSTKSARDSCRPTPTLIEIAGIR